MNIQAAQFAITLIETGSLDTRCTLEILKENYGYPLP